MIALKSLRQMKADLSTAEAALLAEANGLVSAAVGGTLTAEQAKRKDEIKSALAANKAKREEVNDAIVNAERAAELAADSGVAVTEGLTEAAKEDPMKGFKNPKDFLVAVINHDRGIAKDKRLALVRSSVMATVGSDEHSIADNTHGGFLVPEGMVPGLLSRSVETDPFAGMTPVPMSVPTLHFPARVDSSHTTSVSGGLTVTRRPETVAATSSRATYEKITLNATGLFGLSYASQELLTYSPQSFGAIIQAGFADEFLAKGIDERVNGSGAGEPEGVLTSPALITITKETDQDADTIVYENILKMRARCWGYGNAVWIANHDTLPTLAQMVLVTGTSGVPVFVPNTTPATLLGRPIYFTEFTKTVGDKGDILLVNTSQILDGTLQPLQSAESIHVRFDTHETCFKVWTYNDSKCWWRAALTPKNSTTTMSPFVCIEAR